MMAVAIWMLASAMGIGALLIATAMNHFGLQLALAGIVSGFIAVKSIRDQREMVERAAPLSEFARMTIRHMALVWTWCCLAVITTYSLLVDWDGAWAMIPVLLLASGLCHFVSMILAREHAGNTDPQMLAISWGLCKAHVAIASLGFGALIAAGRFSASAFGTEPKWAAINILASGCIALAVISANALRLHLEGTVGNPHASMASSV